MFDVSQQFHLSKQKWLKTIADFNRKYCQAGPRTIWISSKCHRLFSTKSNVNRFLDVSYDNWQKRHEHVLVYIFFRVCLCVCNTYAKPTTTSIANIYSINVQQDDTQAIWFWHFHYYFQIKHIAPLLQFFFHGCFENCLVPFVKWQKKKSTK